MSKVAPFKGFYYNTDVIKNLSDVVVPPYDNIPAGEDQKYFNRSPYNFAHVILPKSKDEDYSRSTQLLSKWRETNVLKEDTTPHYYLYQQTFEALGKKYNRRTLMCTVELHDFSDAIVRPHENTYGQYKADRLLILKKTQCNLSHIFGMVKDKRGVLETLYEKWTFEKPFLTGHTDEGVDHAVWKIPEPKALEVAKFFEDEPIYIVDGHHRYESSLMYAKEQNAVGNPRHPASHMLFAISNAYDPGLVVFPTHRLVKGGTAPTKDAIEKQFVLTEKDLGWLTTFVKTSQSSPQFALYLGGKVYHVSPKNWMEQESALGKSVAKLGVTWSDHFFLKNYCGVEESNRKERIHYERDLDTAWKDKDKFSLMVFHAPPAVTDVTDVADEKRFMPQKSTYFYPKLAAGFIMRKH